MLTLTLHNLSEKDSRFLHETLLSVACLKLRSRAVGDNLFRNTSRASILMHLPPGMRAPTAQVMASYRTVGLRTINSEPLAAFFVRVTPRMREPLYIAGVFLPRFGHMSLCATVASGAESSLLVGKLVFRAYGPSDALADARRHRDISWAVDIVYSSARKIAGFPGHKNTPAALLQPHHCYENTFQGASVGDATESSLCPVSQPKSTIAQPCPLEQIKLEDIPPDLLTRKRPRGRPTKVEVVMRRMLLQQQLMNGIQDMDAEAHTPAVLDSTL